MRESNAPVTLLRVAATVIDALVLALLLVLPASIISYTAAWIGDSTRAVVLTWWIALAIFFAGLLLRDGWQGRSPGKRLFGLRLVATGAKRCGYGRSILRNLPLIVPGWNVVEFVMLLVTHPSRRTGDLLARTAVTEE